MIQKIIPTVVFLAISGFILAQSSGWQINGEVKNDEGEQLPGASVFIGDSIRIIADEQGQFRFVYRGKLPVSVVARYVGALPYRVVLNKSDFSNGTATINLILNSDDGQLNEVSIDAARIKKIAEEDFTTDIYDYEFIDGKLLLLMRVKKRYYLRLTTESGTMFDQIQLPYPAKRLFRSCLNGLHIVGDLYAQEITLKSAIALDTLPRYSINKFIRLLEPCVAENGGTYFFKKNGLMNQSVEYHYIDEDDGQWHQLAFITNTAGLTEAEKALGDFLTGKPMMVARPWGESSISDGIGTIDHDFMDFSAEELIKKANTNSQIAQLGNIERIKTDSVFAPLFKSGDTIFLFNHVDGQLRTFKNPEEEFAPVPIHYQKDKGWVSELFFDRRMHRFYSFYWVDGQYLLKRINTTTGLTEQIYPLDEMPLWSKKLKVYNGYIYYLGQEDPNIPNYILKKIDFQRRSRQN